MLSANKMLLAWILGVLIPLMSIGLYLHFQEEAEIKVKQEALAREGERQARIAAERQAEQQKQARIAAEHKAAEEAKAAHLRAISFVDQGGGVLKDSQTELEWTQSDNGRDIYWNEATNYCASLSGHWRLPSIAELGAICRTYEGGTDKCEVSPLFRLTGDKFWSGDQEYRSLAWYVKRNVVGGFSEPIVGLFGISARALCVSNNGVTSPSADVNDAPLSNNKGSIFNTPGVRWTH
jgi:hypothetical protein